MTEEAYRTDHFGLREREAFLASVNAGLQAPEAKHQCVAALDIEHLKLLNNWYGQKTGDEILRRVAERLRKLEQEKGYIAGHFGSDDFFLFMPDDDEQIQAVYDQMIEATHIGTSVTGFRPVIGVCAVSEGGEDAALLCNNAQIAMDEARGHESDCIHRFDHRLSESIHRKQRLLSDMKKALQVEGFTFYLQPKCNIATGKIIGMEALARWVHPQLGSISPAEFIPLMEQSGLVTWLDRFMWEGICKTLRDWRQKGHKVVPISVNVSRQDFEVIDVPACFKALTERYQVPPQLLRVEITETVFAENLNIIREGINRLHEYGFTVLMDDFGSGYSSLNMLKETNVDVLKMDMKFIKMNRDNASKGIQIIESVVEMAHRLNMRVVTEGVETREQAELLLSLNCVYVQGYYYYRPMPVAEAETLLDRADPEDYACSDLRRKGMEMADTLQDLKAERDVMNIMMENAMVLSALNLDTGELRFAKRGIELPQVDADKPIQYAMFNNLVVAQKLIHPEDEDGYLRGTALSTLRTEFFGGKRQVYLRYRQKIDGEYRWVALAIVAEKRCMPGHANVAMVLSGASGDGHANRPNQPRQVDYDCDTLTGLLNRGRFERDLEWWSEKRPEVLTCIYIDVVGLHEINNHLGHKAGDSMLCTVAGAMQHMFPKAETYRIGGDEFVALWFGHTKAQGVEAAARLKTLLRESDYEVSVGVHQIEPQEELVDGVDRAENAMRRDKEAYYRETGNAGQMRVLNEKLERILTEKQDADVFLRAIAPHYMGVYVVNNDTGRMRSIFIPERFRQMVKEANGLFIPALEEYAREVVADKWRGDFDQFLDLKSVIRRVEREGMVYLSFQRKDDVWIRLQVMRYMPDENESNGTLWIFSAAAVDEQRA